MFDPGMRDAIKMVLLDGLRQKGRTINEIEKARGIQGDPEVAAHANEPVWYDLDGLRRFVAKRLRMDEDSVVGRGRKSEHFMMITKQEISALRRAGTIRDWRAGSGRGVFRVAGRLPPPPPDSGISVKDRKYGRQLGRPTGDDDLHDSFILMLEGPMQETYKFALARAILDYCHENGGSPTPDYSIPYAYLAEKFLEYYWKLQWFGIRQNRRGKENRVFKAIRETFGDEKPESFQAARAFHRTQCDTVRGIILDNVFGHAKTRTSVVVHAFQKIRVSPYTVSDNVFYEPDDDKSRITMNTEALLFLNRNYDMLRSAVLLRWAVRLEELNPSMIKVMTKIAMEDIRRSDLTWAKKILGKRFGDCFYCKGCLKGSDWHADHFIPWSYVLDDKLWNLVQSCPQCNGRKGNSLPSEEDLDRIRKRNTELRRETWAKEHFNEYDDSELPRLYGMYQSCRRR